MRINLEGFTEQEVLQFVLDGLYRSLEAVQQSIAGVKAQLAGAAPAKTPAKTKAPAKTGGRRLMSPEARERIAAAQRKRWKAHHKLQKAASGAPVVTRKRRAKPAAEAEAAPELAAAATE